MENYFKDNLKYLRNEGSKTQADIALQVNKGYTTIGNWEKGLSEPNNTELILLAKYFGVTTDELLMNDLSKGNLNENQNDAKKHLKSNLKSNPIGNLNEENQVYFTKNNIEIIPESLPGGLSNLQALQEQQLSLQHAINRQLTAIIANISEEIQR